MDTTYKKDDISVLIELINKENRNDIIKDVLGVLFIFFLFFAGCYLFYLYVEMFDSISNEVLQSKINQLKVMVDFCNQGIKESCRMAMEEFCNQGVYSACHTDGYENLKI